MLAQRLQFLVLVKRSVASMDEKDVKMATSKITQKREAYMYLLPTLQAGGNTLQTYTVKLKIENGLSLLYAFVINKS